MSAVVTVERVVEDGGRDGRQSQRRYVVDRLRELPGSIAGPEVARGDGHCGFLSSPGKCVAMSAGRAAGGGEESFRTQNAYVSGPRTSMRCFPGGVSAGCREASPRSWRLRERPRPGGQPVSAGTWRSRMGAAGCPVSGPGESPYETTRLRQAFNGICRECPGTRPASKFAKSLGRGQFRGTAGNIRDTAAAISGGHRFQSLEVTRRRSNTPTQKSPMFPKDGTNPATDGSRPHLHYGPGATGPLKPVYGLWPIWDSPGLSRLYMTPARCSLLSGASCRSRR